ncbi:MAG: DUF268 domain-containing protein [Terracidiphilus sp.]
MKNPTMRRYRRCLSRIVEFLGFYPRGFIENLIALPGFVRDMSSYRRMCPSGAFRIRLLDLFPILNDRKKAAGSAGGDYFHQDLWAARKIFQRRPERHIDIGSRMDGFIAHLLVFMSVTVIDIRALQSPLAGLTFFQDDATELRSFQADEIDSLSCLHAAEHFGLGRYSDPVDPNACFLFMSSLQRVLRPGGRLYFSLPIGRERVDFNAHRVFFPSTIMAAFARLSLVSFSYVDDAGSLHENTDPAQTPDLEYGCGLFEFTKQGRLQSN